MGSAASAADPRSSLYRYRWFVGLLGLALLACTLLTDSSMLTLMERPGHGMSAGVTLQVNSDTPSWTSPPYFNHR
jgi:MYXO-CTERM domain-containing protein